MLRVGTPTDEPGLGTAQDTFEEQQSKRQPALRIRARFNLMDLFEDSKAVQLSVQVCLISTRGRGGRRLAYAFHCFIFCLFCNCL